MIGGSDFPLNEMWLQRPAVTTWGPNNCWACFDWSDQQQHHHPAPSSILHRSTCNTVQGRLNSTVRCHLYKTRTCVTILNIFRPPSPSVWWSVGPTLTANTFPNWLLSYWSMPGYKVLSVFTFSPSRRVGLDMLELCSSPAIFPIQVWSRLIFNSVAACTLSNWAAAVAVNTVVIVPNRPYHLCSHPASCQLSAVCQLPAVTLSTVITCQLLTLSYF